jgi:hypothetical protein
MAFDEPKRIAKLLHSYSGSWAIAGGWAIDLFLNKETRKHKDIDILLVRDEQIKFKHYLPDWKFSFVENGSFIDWTTDQYLHLPIHEIYAVNKAGEQIEVLLNDVIDGEWRFRRNPTITYPVEQLIIKSKLSIPIVSPEVVLLYKAKINLHKDRLDVKATLPELQTSKVNWLKQAIEATHGYHPWLD